MWGLSLGILFFIAFLLNSFYLYPCSPLEAFFRLLTALLITSPILLLDWICLFNLVASPLYSFDIKSSHQNNVISPIGLWSIVTAFSLLLLHLHACSSLFFFVCINYAHSCPCTISHLYPCIALAFLFSTNDLVCFCWWLSWFLSSHHALFDFSSTHALELKLH